jgi:hypothetical protein
MSVITSSSFAKALWPGVNAWYGKSYAEFPVEYTKLFDKFNSSRAYEEDVGITSFGLAQVKPEGQAIATIAKAKPLSLAIAMLYMVLAS